MSYVSWPTLDRRIAMVREGNEFRVLIQCVAGSTAEPPPKGHGWVVVKLRQLPHAWGCAQEAERDVAKWD